MLSMRSFALCSCFFSSSSSSLPSNQFEPMPSLIHIRTKHTYWIVRLTQQYCALHAQAHPLALIRNAENALVIFRFFVVVCLLPFVAHGTINIFRVVSPFSQFMWIVALYLFVLRLHLLYCLVGSIALFRCRARQASDIVECKCDLICAFGCCDIRVYTPHNFCSILSHQALS